MIVLKEIRKRYESGFELAIRRMEIGEGRITALLGPNGSGKSTLLRIIAGIEKPDRGTVEMDGLSIGPEDAVPLEWRRRVTLVSQSPYMFDGSVEDNVLYGLRVRRCPRDERRRRLREALSRVGLEGFGPRPAAGLSTGEAQRVAIARALVIKPRLLLLDEPTGGIDGDNAAGVEEVISSLEAGGPTVVIATHDHDQAYRLSGDLVSVIGGRAVEAAPENVFTATIRSGPGGIKIASLRGGVEVEVETDISGSAHVAVEPTAIIVSRKRIESSARNCLAGVVRSVTARGPCVGLVVEAGVNMTAIVTARSFREMGLHPGDSVYLTFKATAVRVF